MTKLIILDHEICELRAADEKEKKRSQRSTKRIPNGGLRRGKAQARLQAQNRANMVVVSSTLQLSLS
jgi:hypothetical protein